MHVQNDTIAALSTAPGEAGIAIVRVSGPLSLAIADRIFRGSGPKPSERPANTFMHGFVTHQSSSADRQIADEVILLIFRAPNSYTREDVVEVQGHGGRVCARRLLQSILEAGARMARPGEFTMRAFLHGRLDLMQAEAVADLIQARSDRAAAAAIEQLEGSLSNSFRSLYENMVRTAAQIEVTLDFSDDDNTPLDFASEVLPQLDIAIAEAQRLLSSWHEGRLLREGARVVIAGKPNVGKSTLLNALLGSDRAIVTEIPGTTRDTLEESLVLDGIPIRLVDTAGLRETTCRIELEGVRRTHAALEKADVVLCVLDASQAITTEEVEFISSLQPDRRLVIANKTDLGVLLDLKNPLLSEAVCCSLHKRTSLDPVKIALLHKLQIVQGAPPHAVISSRHRELIVNCIASLKRSHELLLENPQVNSVMAVREIRIASEYISNAIGSTYTTDMLNNIFSSFCIGK